MNIIKGFLVQHKNFYTNLITMSRTGRTLRRKSDLEPIYLSRIAQSVVLFIGILELIDPSDIDYFEIVRYISAILKG